MASSIKSKRRSAAQLAADGFAALVQELGMAEAVRYVQLYHQGAGDYTRDRHEWLNEISPAQLTKLMAGATKKQPPRKRSLRKAR